MVPQLLWKTVLLIFSLQTNWKAIICTVAKNVWTSYLIQYLKHKIMHCFKFSGKKLRNGLKYSRVTVLPDILSIHLKRFRHEFAFSSKVSTKVVFPLVDLDMSPWLHTESISKVWLADNFHLKVLLIDLSYKAYFKVIIFSKESTYELIGVICHHGTAGGGHYTSYALNHLDNLWYEFDDSSVTQVFKVYDVMMKTWFNHLKFL